MDKGKKISLLFNSFFFWLSFVLGVTFLIYLPVLEAQFLDWDDYSNIVNNPYFRKLSLHNLNWVWGNFFGGHYTPLTWVSFYLDFRLWGMRPFGFHLTNLIIHLANVFVLFMLSFEILYKKWGDKLKPAFIMGGISFGVLFFSLHPIHVESVAWVTQRRDLLASFFLLIASLLYLKKGRFIEGRFSLKNLLPILGLYLLSLFSKAIGMVFPLVLLLFDFYPLGRLKKDNWISLAFREKGGFWFLSFLFGLIAMNAQVGSSAAHSLQDYTLWHRVGQSFYGVGFYFLKMWIPLKLSPLYELPLDWGPYFIPILVSVCFFWVTTFLFWKKRERAPFLFTVWGLFILFLSPTLGIAQSGPQMVALRYTYLASMGWGLLGGGFFLWIFQKGISSHLKVLTVFLGCVYLSLMIGQTRHQINVWKDDESLWSHGLSVFPESPMILGNLGLVRKDQQRLEEAAIYLRKSLQIKPKHAYSLNNYANVLKAQKKWQEALIYYDRALEMNQHFSRARYNRAGVYGILGRGEKAEKDYRQVIQEDSRFVEAYNNLGNLLMKQNRRQEALPLFQQAVSLTPLIAEPYNNLGIVLSSLGRSGEAIPYYKKALSLNPRSWVFHFNAALDWEKLGEKEQALFHYQKAFQLNPKNKKILTRLNQLKKSIQK